MERKFYYNATQRLCSSLQLEESLQSYFELIKQVLPIDGIFLNIYRPEFSDIQFLAHVNDQLATPLENQVPISKEMEQLLQQADRPVIRIVNDISLDSVTQFVAPKVIPGIKSLILMRMVSGNTHLGIVGFYSKTVGVFKTKHADMIEPHMQTFSLITAFNLKDRNLLMLNQALTQQNRSLKRVIFTPNGVVGGNAGLKKVMNQVEAIAKLNTSVLLQGETGCGKEVIANAVHEQSSRSSRPFIKVNCGAIPETLIDSELFGYEKGAFTGAEKRKAGHFEQANGGTIFLDEIGELPLSAQVRLLRVLQNSTITRVGGHNSVQLDIRVIAATHRNLQAMVHSGEFREDLWYRLAIFPIEIPSLRQRRSDIPILVQHFLEVLSAKFNLSKLPRVSTEQLDTLNSYQWPGNVRELMNVLERAIIQSPQGPLNFDFISASKSEEAVETSSGETIVIDPSHASDKLVPLDIMISKYIEHAMRVTGGKLYGTGGAAELLDINPNTLRSKMKKLGIC
ncbi:sigma-54-dependent Fis family transcriptional regulator [Shewanella eurypsychrophilus]|uniref:Sigma-54-dependent Fis family transcriptional regulator n=1 Tax=Shewanella eurypsychrophilus TaxID=2593656 RepID=A0ABX6V490_9GAMM|nr:MULTISPECIES: sigma-54-dependent Fis family transcriptional regulator [Shewanella]QFU22179.1 AAA family ATPase [Shewanella sp. YLB-09]QPG57466.1 sigma-54-dependent Fis family transcriptional regulator [Shewanella eurypsychrophilus]